MYSFWNYAFSWVYLFLSPLTLASLHSSVQFSSSVMSDCLWHHGLQHTRPPCASPTPGAYSNSCPLSQWCHLTISSSGIPFSSHLQSSPASGSFQMSLFFASGGQSLGVSATASILTMTIQGWFPLGKRKSKETDWFDLLAVQGTHKSLLQQHSLKTSIFGTQPSFSSNTHIHTWLLEKT